MSHKFVHVKSDLYVNTLAFHARREALLAGTVSGELKLYTLNGLEGDLEVIWSNQSAHRKSVRRACFFEDGHDIVAASADKKLSVIDVEGNRVKWYGKGHKGGISTLCIVDKHTIATGADDGEIRIWDTRLDSTACRSKVSEFISPISGIMVGKTTAELLAISDDQLGCFDLRRGKVSLQGMSDNVEDELQCFVPAKGMKKVVCGSNTGNLCLFSYGHWGDLNDRMDVHQSSIDSIAAYDDDTILIGGDDGDIHVVSILPNEVKGHLKPSVHLGFATASTDSLCLSTSGAYLAFVADFDHICVMTTESVTSVLEGEAEEDSFFGDL